MKRVFLGWDGPLLVRAARWLVGEFGSDLLGVVVALPGARSGRILGELLAREVGAGLRPPTVRTAGALSDELLEVEGVAASRVVRTLAWEQALRSLSERELVQLVARPPADEARRAWATLAEEVRGLFGEVAAEGLDFGAVARSTLLEELDGERSRWQVLARAQERMAELLAEAGLHDPHLGRLAAIEAGRVRAPRHVVLVGVVESNELLQRALNRCEAPRTALVFAPEEEREGFDEFGCLLAESWSRRETALRLDQWHVVDRPEDQARAATRVLASWGGRFAAEQVSVGLADSEVSPSLKSRLAEVGVRARDAAGVAMARTRPPRLLAALGGFLRSRSFLEFASLVRHPDLEQVLLRALEGVEPIEVLDRYHGEHLPWRADGEWLADPSRSRDLALRREMNTLWRATREALGGVLTAGSAPLAEQTARLRAFLEGVYAAHELDTTEEGDRVLITSLRCLASALDELDEVPENLATEGSLADVIELLLRIATSPANDIPPAAAREGEPTIEMMGWLELPLDDAPALVVTGFEDGKVPESLRGDAFLPNRLRRDLGLVDNEQRLARDLYATELLVRSREEVAFISGRRNLAGDPLMPSRVVFHCAEDEVAERVRRFLKSESSGVARVEAAQDTGRELPRGGEVKTPEVITVSAFKSFLDSPYAYYLKHVLRLDTIDDRARELDGAAFGNLAHAVLQRFGQDERARDERDSEKIADYLAATLRELGAAIYGSRPLPAVRLQLEQLEWRLRRFAGLQALRRAKGWCIHSVEWMPSGGTVDFVVDKTPIALKGRIDRIDRHEESGAWAIWDYKTGETVTRPLSAHRRQDGQWRDLQLPLYCLLAGELLADHPPAELGYIALGRDDKSLGFWSVEDWRRPRDECDDSDEALLGGLERAHAIVRSIRAGDYFRLAGWQPYDEIFGAIGGVGLVASAGSALGGNGEGAQ